MCAVHSLAKEGDRSRALGGVLAGLASLTFFFVFPRAVVRWLGESSPWTSYLYLYGNGLVVFLIGIGVILRSGACRLGRGRDTSWFVVLLLGYVFFAAMHAAWILAALYLPVKGAL